MRAVAAAGACALLLAGSAPTIGLPSDGSQAKASECSWSRHAKRVVKHIRRDGQPRRVVRIRHWWSCDAIPAAPAGTAVASPAPVPAPTPQPEPEANRVGVSSHDKNGEFRYQLTRQGVRAGKVTVELNNQGEDPHNLNLQRQSEASEPVFPFANTLPGEQTVDSFELPAGTYRLWCSLPEHDEKGMHATLIVE